MKKAAGLFNHAAGITEHEAFTLETNTSRSPHRAAGELILSMSCTWQRGLLNLAEEQNRCSPLYLYRQPACCPGRASPLELPPGLIPALSSRPGAAYSERGNLHPPGRRGAAATSASQSFAKAVGNQSGLAGLLGLLQPHVFNRRPWRWIGPFLDDWTNSFIGPEAACPVRPGPGRGAARRGSLTGMEPALSGWKRRPPLNGRRRAAVLYFAVNLESDGAGTSAVDLMRRAPMLCTAETEAWLEEHRLHAAKDLTPVLNRNLF